MGCCDPNNGTEPTPLPFNWLTSRTFVAAGLTLRVRLRCLPIGETLDAFCEISGQTVQNWRRPN
jgi:hypothetical protein